MSNVLNEAPPHEIAAEWEIKLEQLRTANEELQRRKADAEKDRELFRELYGKASAYASDVTKENNELLERATLAESQVRDGLVMIKATYKERVRCLGQEVEKWKSLCNMLTTRDQRTDDEVRRKAALELELREENARLKERLEGLEKACDRMEDVLDELAEDEVNDELNLERSGRVFSSANSASVIAAVPSG